MCDDDIHVGLIHDPTVSRRTFGLLTAVGAAAAATGARARASDVMEMDVEVATPDGVADSVLIHPTGEGTWPAVLIWTDIAGLRPTFREMGRRLAAEGYVVLVPNPFYRSVKGQIAGEGFNFANPEDRARVMSYRQAMTPDGVDRDAVAYLAFLDGQKKTDTKRRAGVQGYCMGGPLSFRTAGAVPGRIGAVASFHGGGLVTEEATSPHLLIPKTEASYLVAVAQNDDAKEPQTKEVLKQAFEAAGRPATVEVYPAAHGWCVKGSQVYDEAQAERAWAELLKLYGKALA